MAGGSIWQQEFGGSTTSSSISGAELYIWVEYQHLFLAPQHEKITRIPKFSTIYLENGSIWPIWAISALAPNHLNLPNFATFSTNY